MRIGGGTRGPLRVAAYPLCDIVEERLSLSVLPGGARWGVQLVRTRRAAGECSWCAVQLVRTRRAAGECSWCAQGARLWLRRAALAYGGTTSHSTHH